MTRAYTLIENPRSVDVAIVGAGTAGLGAYRAAKAAGRSAVLIEGGAYGTTCARVGCMPSKLLIAAAEAAHAARDTDVFGVRTGPVEVDGRAVMRRVRDERDRFVGFVVDSTESIDPRDRLRGWARFEGPDTLSVSADGEAPIEVRFRTAVVATGSTPIVLPFLQAAGDRLLINDDVFDWDDLPRSVAVFGPGVIGLELGQALHRLGVRVRVFGKGGLLGPISDPEILAEAHRVFRAELDIDTDATVHAVRRIEEGVDIEFDRGGERRTERFEYVLAAIGRRSAIGGLNLQATGIELGDDGLPDVDPATGRVGESHIFLAGDVTGDRPLLHEASDEGRAAGANAATWPGSRPIERRAPLAVVFSDPQILMVGERFADLEPGTFVVGRVDFGDQGRSRVMHQNRGRLHVYVDVRSGRLLGAEGIGPRAEHLAHLLAWSVQDARTVEHLLEMPFYHPVVEEGLRTALRDARAKLDVASMERASA